MAGLNWNLLDPNAAEKAAGAFQQGQANRLAMEQAQQEQQANALALQAKQQQSADANALRDIYKQSGGDVNKVIYGMKQAGMYQPAMEMEAKLAASQQEQQKLQLQRAKDTLGLIKDQSRFIMANPTLANATAALDQVQAATGQDMSQYKASILQLGDNPDAIRQWAAGHALEADKLLPHFEKFDTGGQIMSMTVDPITGKTVQTGAVKKTMTPGEIAADARARAQLAQSERHFQGTQALEREKIASKGGESGTPAAQVKTAQDALGIIDDAEQILNRGKATGSYGGKTIDVIAGAAGISTPGAKEAASLKALAGALVSKMPKMSGPQSDKDVQLYREMAGQIGDETVPIDTRKAALKTVRALQEKYAGQKPSSGAHPSDIQDLLDKYK